MQSSLELEEIKLEHHLKQKEAAWLESIPSENPLITKRFASGCCWTVYIEYGDCNITVAFMRQNVFLVECDLWVLDIHDERSSIDFYWNVVIIFAMRERQGKVLSSGCERCNTLVSNSPTCGHLQRAGSERCIGLQSKAMREILFDVSKREWLMLQSGGARLISWYSVSQRPFGNQSIERDHLIWIGFVFDFVEFISFTFGDKEMISVIKAVSR
ncbi:hypothetical protein Tco_1038494 [Tanacetum coccineum]